MRRNQGLGNLENEPRLERIILANLRSLSINLQSVFVSKHVVGVHRFQHELHVSIFELCKHLQR